jgi:type IV secretion system protein VirB11
VSASETSALAHYVQPIAATLRCDDVTELCINRPGELWVESSSGWARRPAAWATFTWAAHFARLLAASSQQRLSSQHPLLSSALPGGERVQIVMPPATAPGTIIVSIRRNRVVSPSLANLIRDGFTDSCRPAESAAAPDAKLAELYRLNDWGGFMREAVRARQNILVCGATGSGKTTLIRALIAEIDPDERLVTIEDTPELDFPAGSNAVRLFYSKDDQGLSRLSVRHLLEASLRLRPERILLAELRGDEAYQYLRAVNSGHPGSITSIHASSCRLAFEQLALLVKESAAGREMGRAEIHSLLRQVVDVVVHCGHSRGRRQVREVWWRDAAGAAGHGRLDCAARGTAGGAGATCGADADDRRLLLADEKRPQGHDDARGDGARLQSHAGEPRIW